MAKARGDHLRRNDFDHGPMIDLGRTGQLAYRAVNKFSRSDIAARLGLKGKPVTAYVKATFRGRYDASNAALQAYCEDDLAALGYPLAR